MSARRSFRLLGCVSLALLAGGCTRYADYVAFVPRYKFAEAEGEYVHTTPALEQGGWLCVSVVPGGYDGSPASYALGLLATKGGDRQPDLTAVRVEHVYLSKKIAGAWGEPRDLLSGPITIPIDPRSGLGSSAPLDAPIPDPPPADLEALEVEVHTVQLAADGEAPRTFKNRLFPFHLRYAVPIH